MVEKAMTEHHRKKSQYDALQSSLGLIFDKEDVNTITKDVMKKVFAQKHQHNNQQQQMQQMEEFEQVFTGWSLSDTLLLTVMVSVYSLSVLSVHSLCPFTHCIHCLSLCVSLWTVLCFNDEGPS